MRLQCVQHLNRADVYFTLVLLWLLETFAVGVDFFLLSSVHRVVCLCDTNKSKHIPWQSLELELKIESRLKDTKSYK